MGLFRHKHIDHIDTAGPQAHDMGVPHVGWTSDGDDFDDAGFAQAIAEGRTRDPEPYPGDIDDLKIA